MGGHVGRLQVVALVQAESTFTFLLQTPKPSQAPLARLLGGALVVELQVEVLRAPES